MRATQDSTTCGHCGQELAADALFCPNCGTARSRDEDGDPLLGTVVGARFLILERLGHGGSGTIYRAEHVTLRRKVAIKVLHHELSRDDLAVERFRREATTVGELDNEHIVEIHDFGRTDDGRLYLAMELLEGETLQDVVKRERRLSIARTVDILLQLGEALAEAHAMGYVHRDLRPRNIWLAARRGRSNFVKLLDFGLAKLVAHEGLAAATSLGMTFGDPKYMSPEQARGEPLDRRADIYSMGCIAYEMLVGEPPFASGKLFDILTQHLDADPPSPRERREDVPPWLSSAVLRMLAKDPEDRFVTVSRLIEVLREGAAGGPGQPEMQPAPGRAGLPGAGPAGSVSPAMPSRAPSNPVTEPVSGPVTRPARSRGGTMPGIAGGRAAGGAEAQEPATQEAPAPVPAAPGAHPLVPAPAPAAAASGSHPLAPAAAGAEPSLLPEPSPAPQRPVVVTPAGGIPGDTASTTAPGRAGEPAPEIAPGGSASMLAASAGDHGAGVGDPAGDHGASASISGGLAGAWFADAEGDLDESARKRLDDARALIDPGDTDLVDGGSAYYDPGRRPLGKIAAIGGGVLALALLVVLLWPAGGSGPEGADTAAKEEPGAGASTTPSAAALLARLDGPGDAGTGDAAQPLPADAGVPATGAPGSAGASGTRGTPDNGAAASAEPRTQVRRPPSDRETRPDRDEPAEPGPGARPSTEDAQQAELFARQGQEALRSGNIPSAASSFKKARELDPRNADAVIGQGEIALRQGSYQNALAHLKQAARLRPRSAQVHILLGEAYLGTGNKAQAAASFKRALAIDAGNSRAREGYREATGSDAPG